MERTDIILIHPGAVHGISPVYGELSKSLTSIEQPLWARLIAGYLIDKGWSVEIIDQEAQNMESKEIASYIKKKQPRIAAIIASGHQPSASTQTMPQSREIASALRQTEYSGCIVMAGGHPSALPERTLREEPVDYVIDGEGPVTLDWMLRNGPPHDSNYMSYHCPGLWWWDTHGEIRNNPPAPLIPVEELHGNAWHLLPPLSNYRAHAWQCLDGSPRTPYAAIYTSLGCPYTCSFCMINVFQHTNKYRMRDPLSVVSEICRLYEQGVRTFKIIDELFILNRKHYTSICSDLTDYGLGKEINIWCYARTDTITRDDLPLLRKAGIKWLALGIESGNEEVRNKANRRLKPTTNISQDWDIYDIIKDIRKADINVIGNYIFGLPGDTKKTMQETLDTAIWHNTEFANFYVNMPYPGSKQYDEIAKKRPQDLPETWSAYSQYSRDCKPLRNENLTAAEILGFRDHAFDTYYRGKQYRDMIEKRFGQHGISFINQMLSYKLPRDLLNEKQP